MTPADDPPSGLVDKGPSPGHDLIKTIGPGNLAHDLHAAQFDNPRGYPGLAGLQIKRAKGERLIDHDVLHAMEQEGALARTGDPTKRARGKTKT